MNEWMKCYDVLMIPITVDLALEMTVLSGRWASEQTVTSIVLISAVWESGTTFTLSLLLLSMTLLLKDVSDLLWILPCRHILLLSLSLSGSPESLLLIHLAAIWALKPTLDGCKAWQNHFEWVFPPIPLRSNGYVVVNLCQQQFQC